MNRISRPWLLASIVVALLCIGVSWWLLVRTPVRFGAVAVSSSSGVWRLVYGYAMTVFGVIFGTAYRNLQSLRDKKETNIPGIGPFFQSVFLSVDFWLGVCGSPLVYALIVQATEGGSIAGLTVMAIQNGFFCTVVIAGLNPSNGLIPSKPAGSANNPA